MPQFTLVINLGNEGIPDDKQIEALHIAIIKGLTCNGVKDWQNVTLKSGEVIAVRFGGMA